MPIGDDFDIELPDNGDTFVDIVAKLKAAIETIIEVLEAPIDAGSLDITTGLDFGGPPAINI
jgi:hypothetical protein